MHVLVSRLVLSEQSLAHLFVSFKFESSANLSIYPGLDPLISNILAVIGRQSCYACLAAGVKATRTEQCGFFHYVLFFSGILLFL